jgi:sulfoacetaldehyde dehydrogenase
MVKAASSSGTPAEGVGPGNSVQIVAEDANGKDAAGKIILSKAFDYATSCSSENSVVIQNAIYDEMIKEFEALGSYFVKNEERQMLEDYMWQINRKGYKALNAKIVAQSAEKIAEGAGIKVPAGTKVLFVEGADDIENDWFSQEKLSPVLTVFNYEKFEEGYEILVRLTDNCGTGHSCGIHTNKKEYVEHLGLNMKSS